MREMRRIDYRRTRRGRGKKDDDVGDVRRARSEHDATRALRFRSAATFQSRQGVSPHSPLRGENRILPLAISGDDRKLTRRFRSALLVPELFRFSTVFAKTTWFSHGPNEFPRSPLSFPIRHLVPSLVLDCCLRAKGILAHSPRKIMPILDPGTLKL